MFRIRTPLLLLALSLPLGAQVSVTLEPSRDNTLYDVGGGELSNGAGSYLFAGLTGSGFARRSLLAFDVAGSVPAGSTITSVSVQLRCSKTIVGPVSMGLFPVEEDWGEAGSTAPGEEGGGGVPQNGDATWISRFFPGQAWSTPGGTHSATASAVQNVGGVGNYTWTSTPALVADVQSWLDSPSTNYGWMLRGQETSSPSAKRFNSRENTNTSQRPRLNITYTAAPSSVMSVGTGCTGSAGTPHTLSAVGLPSVGNAGFALNAAGGPAGQPSLLLLAANTAAGSPLLSPSCLVFLEQSSALLFLGAGISPASTAVLNGAGSASLPLPIPNSNTLFGAALGAQAFSLDPGELGGFATSNALLLRLGA